MGTQNFRAEGVCNLFPFVAEETGAVRLADLRVDRTESYIYFYISPYRRSFYANLDLEENYPLLSLGKRGGGTVVSATEWFSIPRHEVESFLPLGGGEACLSLAPR